MQDNSNSLPPTAVSFACFMFAALLLWFSWVQPPLEQVLDRDQLESATGTVRSLSQTAAIAAVCGTRGCSQLGEPAHFHLRVDVDGKGTEDLEQDPGLVGEVPALMRLQPGDSVSLLVQSRADSKLEHWIDGTVWQVKRGDETILDYADTRKFVERNYGHPVFWERLAAFILFVIGIAIFWAAPVQNLDDMED